MLSCDSKIRQRRPNHRANNNAAFNSNRGTVNDFSGANFVFVPIRKTDWCAGAFHNRTYATTVYPYSDASQKPNR